MSVPAGERVQGRVRCVSEVPADSARWPVPAPPLALVRRGDVVCIGLEGGAISLYDGATGEELGALTGHSDGSVLALASAGRFLVSGGCDGAARVWDVERAVVEACGSSEPSAAALVRAVQLEGTTRSRSGAWVEAVAATEDCKGDGPFFAAASGKCVTVFSASDALEPTTLAPLGSTVTDLSFMRRPGEADADAELAATCYGGVSVWHASSKSGAEPAIHMPYKGALESLAVSPHGGDWVVAGCQDRTVRIWFRPDWEARNYEMGGYVTKVTACAFDASGKQMASNGGGMKGTVPMVWNFSGEGPAHTVPVGLFGHDEQVRLLAWAPDKCDLVRGKGGLGALATAGDDKTLLVWDVDVWEEGLPKRCFPFAAATPEERIAALGWTRRGCPVVALESGHVVCYRLPTPLVPKASTPATDD